MPIFRREQRVLHPRYGRGTVHLVRLRACHARVQFDDDRGVPRTVRLADLIEEPANMPAPYRLIWPLAENAGEGEVS